MLNRAGLFLILFIFSTNFTLAQTSTTTPATPKISVTPTTQTVKADESATVKITSSNADKCTITGEPYTNFDIIKNGNILLRPAKNTVYTFVCKNKAGVSATTQATINVTQPVQSVQNTTQPRANTTQNPPTGQNQNANTQTNTPQQNQQQNAPRNTQYSQDTIQGTANQLCAKYSAYATVYPPASPGGGGGSVPVDLTNLAVILLSIDKNTQLTANEMRQDNLFRYCSEYQNMAAASKKLSENAAKEIKNLADNCYADKKCQIGRVYKASLEAEFEVAAQDQLYPQQLVELLRNMNSPKPDEKAQELVEMQKKCNDFFDQNFYAKECMMVPKAFETIVEIHYAALDNIAAKTNEIASAYNPDGVMGSRPCIRTASGRPPEEIRFYEPDCIEYRQEPSLINQEALRQITALPYTQAFSPSSVLGYDGVLDNIGTRSREGNLLDGNITPNFGSTGGTNPTNPGAGVDLKSIEGNYKQIAINIGVIIQLYDVARLAYASSTSVCRVLPVATRRSAVDRIDQNKNTYIAYLTNLKSLWDAAVAKPRENHAVLITKVNFDLKDKYDQKAIDAVYDAVKKLLQTCVDANTGAGT